MPAHHAQRRPVVVANARHSPLWLRFTPRPDAFRARCSVAPEKLSPSELRDLRVAWRGVAGQQWAALARSPLRLEFWLGALGQRVLVNIERHADPRVVADGAHQIDRTRFAETRDQYRVTGITDLPCL